MNPEEEFEKWWATTDESYSDVVIPIARAAWREAYRLGLTRAAEICGDIKVSGKGGAPTCHQAILTERDKEGK